MWKSVSHLLPPRPTGWGLSVKPLTSPGALNCALGGDDSEH